MSLTNQHLNHFETFGFLKLAGVMAPQLGEIVEAFDSVMRTRGGQHDGSKRTAVVPFIDQDERLCALLDDPGILDVAGTILSADFDYIGSDGNYYSGETGWHSDGFHLVGRYIKLAMYLDPVDANSGALRVIPGSHRSDSPWATENTRVLDSVNQLGVPGSEVPAVVLNSQPGDLLAFNHNILHSSWGGGRQRRMFTLNLCSRAKTETEINELKEYIAMHDRFWLDSMYGETMVSTASPDRMQHLEQVLEHQGHLPGLSRLARETMPAPANG
jgi:hypothetical protein